MNDLNVSDQYIQYRDQVLNYTNYDMNLKLEKENQVYIAVFDIPLESGIVGFNTMTLALVFGLNTHIYHGSGQAVTGLEKYPEVMKAMMSLLISCNQALPKMKLTDQTGYYESKDIRAYLKTEKGIYFKELNENCQEDNFLRALMNYVLSEIVKTGKLQWN